jgi:hypothetical protein
MSLALTIPASMSAGLTILALVILAWIRTQLPKPASAM